MAATGVFTKKPKIHTGKKRQPLQEMMLGKLNSHRQKNVAWSPSLTLHQINSKWIKTLKVLEDAVGNIRYFTI